MQKKKEENRLDSGDIFKILKVEIFKTKIFYKCNK